MDRVDGGTGGVGDGPLKGADDSQSGKRCVRGQDDQLGKTARRNPVRSSSIAASTT
ncbi:hypothetical protein ACIO3R_19865 [Streptomyces sp. NPDC087428]|uniref:hypothetical protein n=1 Tax=Streptomyces sp. NPDC087428 TaxID=3365788 RepID=UPI0037FFA9D7